MHTNKATIISKLQQDILHLEGFRPVNNSMVDLGLGPLKEAFPNCSFPLGAVHEFLSMGPESMASASGFLAGLLSHLMKAGGVSLWISSSRKLFPPALITFGIKPDQIIFIDLKKEKHVMWAMEEAMKCGALTAVIGEMRDISFTASRRLQLAVEQSLVTGFILRNTSAKLNSTACVSRWKVASLPSQSVDGIPGVGLPSWRVELLRIRNGRPGVWDIKWEKGIFQPIQAPANSEFLPYREGGSLELLPSIVPLVSEVNQKKAG
jgi:protein ImuA